MDIASLLKLQKIDIKLMELEISIGDLPEEVERLKNQVNKVTDELVKDKNELSECNKTKRRIEGEIELLNNKLKKYQQQVYTVTTNKEYDAISSEIENTKKEIEDNETHMIELLECDDRLSMQAKENEDELKRIEAELTYKNKLLQDILAKNETEANALSEERKTIVQRIHKPLLATYERIRKGRNGRALSEIRNYICSQCFTTIPAQTVVEARKMDSIILCESCGRILISTNNIVNTEEIPVG